MKRILLIISLFMICISCEEESIIEQENGVLGNLEITILSGVDPVSGITIMTDPKTETLITNEEGVVYFNDIEPGDYTVIISLEESQVSNLFFETVIVKNETKKEFYQIPKLSEPISVIPPDVSLLLTQSYKRLQDIFNADGYLAYWGDTGTDMLTSNTGRYGLLDKLDAYDMNSSSSIIEEVFSEHYIQIRGCNYALDNLSNPENDFDQSINKTEIEAHFKFLRGLLYFNLIKLYGNPLLSLTTENDLNSVPNLPQNPNTTYAQIEEDLLFAIRNLPVSESNDRANQLIARALLAKVYMTMAGFPLNETSKYANALEQLKIIQGQYELIADYNLIFNEENEVSNSEILFRIAYDGEENTSSSFNDYWGPIGVAERDALVLAPGFANYFSNLSTTFENPVSFPIEIVDTRFKNSIATFTISDNIIVDEQNPENWRPLKWFNGELPNASFKSSSFDYPLIRYSDILLLLAEAENEVNGPTLLAYNAINEVRQRAFGNDENNIPNNLDKEQFFERIYLERTFELCFEGHRRDDLIRWNRLQEVVDNFNSTSDKQKDYQPHEYVWPIPQLEIDLNPNAIQNPGY